VSQDPVRRIVTEQRNRLVATLLTHLESRLRPLGGEREWQATRKVVMDAVGTYHDLILDVLKVSREDGSIRNETAVELIRAVHMSQRRIEDALVNGRSGGQVDDG
jgi:hypothetical protein